VKHLPPLALFFGGVLLLFAALAAFALWMDASYGKSQLLLPQPPGPGFATSLAQATSLEGVKQTCAAIAEIYDTQSSIIRTQSAHISYLSKVLMRLVLYAGLVLGGVFLLIYFISRRHVLPARQ
jgi:hypothetical protein